jgi:hypothetical protein
MGTVDESERLFAQAAALFIRKLVAPLAGLFANGFPINLSGGDGLFHFKKMLPRKWAFAKPALLRQIWAR